MTAAIDLIGQRFGRLVVVEPVLGAGRVRGRALRWACRCDCGNDHEVRGNILRAGQVRSCGCWRQQAPSERESSRAVNLAGQAFGRLTVVEPVNPINGKRAWRCRCACGRETVVRTGLLTSGNTKSCGCGRMAGLARIRQAYAESVTP